MPVRDFLLDASGDLAVVNGDFAVVGGQTDDENLAAVLQGVQTRLRLFLGECYLDESQGVDYLGKILVKNPDPNGVATELSRAIAATPDVTLVRSAGLVGPDASRSASISYEVQTVYSTNTIAGLVATP